MLEREHEPIVSLTKSKRHSCANINTSGCPSGWTSTQVNANIMISSLPTELKLMVAEFYFAIPDTALSFYDKWCMSKRFDKHFGVGCFRKQTESVLQTIPTFETITTGNPRLEVHTALPRVTYAPCIDNRQNNMKIIKLYDDNSYRGDAYYSVFSTRWLPCLGCQRNQECTQCPFEITTYWSVDIFEVDLEHFMMDMTIHHPFPIEYLGYTGVDDDEEATVLLYNSSVVESYYLNSRISTVSEETSYYLDSYMSIASDETSYYPTSRMTIISDDIEGLSFTKADFKEIVSRYNLNRYLL